MRWGVGEVRGDVKKGEMREEMWGSVLGPHTQIQFPTSPPFLSLHPFPTCQHTSPLSHILLHSPHGFDYVAKLPCDDVTLINFTKKAQ